MKPLALALLLSGCSLFGGPDATPADKTRAAIAAARNARDLAARAEDSARELCREVGPIGDPAVDAACEELLR